jgi:hypothetical protein
MGSVNESDNIGCGAAGTTGDQDESDNKIDWKVKA